MSETGKRGTLNVQCRGQASRASSEIFQQISNLVMSSKIAERQNAGLSVEYEPESQANATLEQAVAETANAESRVQMRSAEAHRELQ